MKDEPEHRVQFNERGEELCDPTPLEIPIGAQRPESLTDQIRRMIRNEMSEQAEEEGNESFREANDFEVAEEDDPEAYLSPYEVVGMQEEILDEQERSDESAEDSGGSADGKGRSERPDVVGSGSERVADADGEGDSDRVDVGTDPREGVAESARGGGSAVAADVHGKAARVKKRARS